MARPRFAQRYTRFDAEITDRLYTPFRGFCRQLSALLTTASSELPRLVASCHVRLTRVARCHHRHRLYRLLYPHSSRVTRDGDTRRFYSGRPSGRPRRLRASICVDCKQSHVREGAAPELEH